MSGSWTAVGVVVSAVVTALGAMFVARQSRRVGDRQSDVDGWDRLAKRHESEIARLDERLSIVERRLEGERSMSRWLMLRVDQLVTFIRAMGLEPPEPTTPSPTREEAS